MDKFCGITAIPLDEPRRLINIIRFLIQRMSICSCCDIINIAITSDYSTYTSLVAKNIPTTDHHISHDIYTSR